MFMLNKKIKVAVIGTGEIGTKAHIPSYLRNANVEIVAIVDGDDKKLKKASKKFKIKNCYLSTDDLFKNQTVDAVSVCTPPGTHTEIVTNALNNNIHVLCEKPMATSQEDAKLMLTTALKNKRALMVGFNLRYEPNYIQTVEAIKAGRVGHPQIIEFNLQSQNPLVNWSKSPWFFNSQAGGGVLIDKGPHVFDMLNYIFDDFPTSVSTVSSTFFNSTVEDSAVCLLEYPGKRIGVGIMSWMASRVIELLSVHGTSQSLFVTPEIFLEANGSDLIQIPMFRKATKMLVNMKFDNLPLFKKITVNTFQLEIDSFVNQIIRKRYDYSTALSGANVVLLSEGAKKSLITGRKIDCLPIGKSTIA